MLPVLKELVTASMDAIDQGRKDVQGDRSTTGSLRTENVNNDDSGEGNIDSGTMIEYDSGTMVEYDSSTMISLKEDDDKDKDEGVSKIEESINHVAVNDLFAPPPGMDDDDEEDSGTMIVTSELKKEEAAKQIKNLESQLQKEKEIYEAKVKALKAEIQQLKAMADL